MQNLEPKRVWHFGRELDPLIVDSGWLASICYPSTWWEPPCGVLTAESILHGSLRDLQRRSVVSTLITLRCLLQHDTAEHLRMSNACVPFKCCDNTCTGCYSSLTARGVKIPGQLSKHSGTSSCGTWVWGHACCHACCQPSLRLYPLHCCWDAARLTQRVSSAHCHSGHEASALSSTQSMYVLNQLHDQRVTCASFCTWCGCGAVMGAAKKNSMCHICFCIG